MQTIERNIDVLLNACKDIELGINIGDTNYMEVRCHLGMTENEVCIEKGKP